jgi:hypothetical protein
MPAHWYAGQRGGGKRAGPPLIPKAPDLVRAARRSRTAALEATGWLWLRSRPRYVDLPDGRTIPFRMAMWTLTLPTAMPESDARGALSQWWKWARNCQGVNSYVWVAELTKRGRVHFHALVTDWIDHGAAAAAWLRCLHRAGGASGISRPPKRLLWVDNVPTAGNAERYVSKYVGKDFGTRADQLVHRYVNADPGRAGDKAPGIEARDEIRRRLCEVIADPRGVQRRWGATHDLERRPIQLIGVDDPGMYKAITTEVRAMPGVRWGERNDHGQGAYYNLDQLSTEQTPRLLSLLREAARN